MCVLQLQDLVVQRKQLRAHLMLNADHGQTGGSEQLRQNFLAAVLIHVGGGLVQENDGLVLDQHPRQRQLLPFAAGEVALGVLEGLLQIVGRKEGVHAQGTQYRLYALPQFRAVQRDVLKEGVVKQKRIL